MDSAIGLSPTYLIVIHFDYGYQGMRKQEVQEAPLFILEAMGIQVATRYREPILAIINKGTKTWLGFLHINLLNPELNGIGLLKGDCIFTLQLQNSKYVIGKVANGFAFSTSTSNRHLRFKSKVLSNYTSREFLGEMMQLGYISRANLEFISIAKQTKEQDVAKVILASGASKQWVHL